MTAQATWRGWRIPGARSREKAEAMIATFRAAGPARFNAALARLYGRQCGIPHAGRLALGETISNPRLIPFHRRLS